MSSITGLCRILFFIAIYTFTSSVYSEVFFSRQDIINNLNPARVVLFELDIELTRINTTGARDASHNWSKQARDNIDQYFKRRFKHQDLKDPRIEVSEHSIAELVSIQRIIERSILSNFQTPLPSKKNFEWSMGAVDSTLIYSLQADYGMFMLIRGGYKQSTDKVEFQYGQASLVDLRTGITVWFNANDQLSGDLRDPVHSQLALNGLFNQFPN